MKHPVPLFALLVSLLSVPVAGQVVKTHPAHSACEEAGNPEERWIGNIYGIISKPRHTGRKQPVAIISHGFNGTHHYGRNYFEMLNALGYQVYAFDFPCGSVHSRSNNDTMNMSVMDEKSDVKAIVHYFRQQPDVDPDGIVLIGESQGGFVTALAAAEIPDRVRAVVLVYPALCIPDNWRERYPEVADIPDTTRLWNVPMGRRFFLELRDIDVFKTIGKYKGPVLIVQGDRDAVVRMEDSRRAVKTYSNARLSVIPGAGHGFQPDEQARSLREIKTFLEELPAGDISAYLPKIMHNFVCYELQNFHHQRP